MARCRHHPISTFLLALAIVLFLLPQLSFAQTFTRDLYLGASGEVVRALQQFLNADEFIIAHEGPGSPGNETQYCGYAARDALIRFQTYYDISPNIG